MKKRVDKSVRLDLVGLDGNAFALMAAFQRQARREGWSLEEINTVLQDARSSDYDHLLAVLQLYCEPTDDENDPF